MVHRAPVEHPSLQAWAAPASTYLLWLLPCFLGQSVGSLASGPGYKPSFIWLGNTGSEPGFPAPEPNLLASIRQRRELRGGWDSLQCLHHGIAKEGRGFSYPSLPEQNGKF